MGDHVIAIDPGPVESALLTFDGERPEIAVIEANECVADRLCDMDGPLAFEMVQSFGMPVGADVFETVLWAGRFVEAHNGSYVERVYRKDVKMHLCHSMKAKDANVRQALLDRFPQTGGGKRPQIGTKTQPGPLYGIKSHLWSALAIAVCWWDWNN